MEDAGYGFGPIFKKQVEVEVVAGESRSRSTLDLSEPASSYFQSSYPMHPINIDGCLQSGAPSLWLGHRSTVDAVLVPAIIDNVEIYSAQTRPIRGIALSSREFVGVGRFEEAQNYKSEIQVHDSDNGSPLLSVSGLRYHNLETHARLHTARNYTHVVWRLDVTWVSRDTLLPLLPASSCNQRHDNNALPGFHQVLDIVAHKKPTLRIIEVNVDAVGSEILRLDVSMNDALRMDIFETVKELVDEHQHSLEREFATAEVKKIFQTRPQKIKHHSIIFTLRLISVNAWNTDTTRKGSIGISFAF